MELMELYKQHKTILETAEEIHDHNHSLGKNSALEIVLPLAYQQLRKRRQHFDFLDDKTLNLLGGFFCNYFPHLETYFLSDSVKEDQAHMQAILEKLERGDSHE